MKMRTRHAAGRSHLPQNSSRDYFVTNFRIDLREVTVERVNSQSMINEHGVP